MESVYNMRLLIHDNKKAWMICLISLGLAMLCYVLFPTFIPSEWIGLGMKDTYSERVMTFFFPALQMSFLAVCDRKRTRRWCLRSKLFPRNIYQYHMTVLAVVIVLLLLELYAMYFAFRY